MHIAVTSAVALSLSLMMITVCQGPNYSPGLLGLDMENNESGTESVNMLVIEDQRVIDTYSVPTVGLGV